MPKTLANPNVMFRFRYLPSAVIAVALTILAAIIFLASNSLRNKNALQLIQQDAQILYALWSSQEFNAESEGQVGIMERASDQLWSVLQTAEMSRMAGVLAEPLGMRLFSPQGDQELVDPNVADGALSKDDLTTLARLKPVAHFRPSADLAEVNFTTPDLVSTNGPLLDVCIPLHSRNQTRLLGIAQFILDGKRTAAEFKTLDRNLVIQATATFVAGGGLLVVLLGWAFRQVMRTNQLLQERTQHLLQANQELALTAKASAVGAITAHLLHGLKNPLSGLQTFVNSQAIVADAPGETDWQLAISSTRRMQNMISQIVHVLRDEQAGETYELSLSEFVSMVEGKVKPLARDAGIVFHCRLDAEGILDNREANLVSLILYNLIQNAIQATPAGKVVALDIEKSGSRIEFQVADQGHGISSDRRDQLFKPCQSTKEGGSGIGLAISKQLAACINAELQLSKSDQQGTVFVMSFQPKEPVPSNGQANIHA